MSRIDGRIVIVEVTIATTKSRELVSNDVTERGTNDGVVFRRFEETANEQVNVSRGLINLLQAFGNDWAKFMEILDGFASVDSEVVVIRTESYIIASLDV